MSKLEDIKAWGTAIADVSQERLAKIVSKGKNVVPRAGVQDIDPDIIKFSQVNVNGASQRTEEFIKHGWRDSVDAVDVVKLGDGTLVSLDNTRILAASRAKIIAKTRVRAPDALLTPEEAVRFTTRKNGVPSTWNEALRFRINKQRAGWRNKYPNGSYVTESLD
tara:strand:- start:276 stop:767 length:492 start_codon:yes stop_codon:yes gene_type:complete